MRFTNKIKFIVGIVSALILGPISVYALATLIQNGGTGVASFGQGWVFSSGGIANLSASTSPTVNYITATSTTATSTFGYGINLSGGCFSLNGTCITGGGGGATLTGSTGQVAYFSGTNTAVGTSTLFIATNGNVGVASSTPGSIFSINNIVNFTTGTTTMQGSGGINLKSGCFSIAGICITGTGGGGGAGSPGGTWATTTSNMAGELINHPLNNTDIVTVGASATTTAPFYFDPNIAVASVGTSSGSNSVLQFSTNWTTGLNSGTGAYDISNGTIIGTNNALDIASTSLITFGYASSTAVSGNALCLGSDCRTLWPVGQYSFTPSTVGGVQVSATSTAINDTAGLLSSGWAVSTSTTICPDGTPTGQCQYIGGSGLLQAITDGWNSIHLKSGIFTITSPIKVPRSGFELDGEGDGSEIRYNGSAVRVGIENATGLELGSTIFRDFTLRETGAGGASTCFDTSRLVVSKFERIQCDSQHIGFIASTTQSFYNTYDTDDVVHLFSTVGSASSVGFYLGDNGSLDGGPIDNTLINPHVTSNSITTSSSTAYYFNSHSIKCISCDSENSYIGMHLGPYASDFNGSVYLEANTQNLVIDASAAGVGGYNITGNISTARTLAEDVIDHGAVGLCMNTRIEFAAANYCTNVKQGYGTNSPGSILEISDQNELNTPGLPLNSNGTNLGLFGATGAGLAISHGNIGFRYLVNSSFSNTAGWLDMVLGTSTGGTSENSGIRFSVANAIGTNDILVQPEVQGTGYAIFEGYSSTTLSAKTAGTWISSRSSPVILGPNRVGSLFVTNNPAVINSSKVSIGTSSPSANLTVWSQDTTASAKAFNVINNASTTLFSIDDTGTTTAANGFNITKGCFSVNGVCITGGGGGAVSSVSNSDGTLSIAPTTGAVTAGLNLGKANSWLALQTFGNASTTNISASYASSTLGVFGAVKLPSAAGSGTNCLQTDNTGLVTLSGGACGTGTVNNVSNSDGSLTISPTTGNVVGTLNVAHTNAWTAFQSFTAATLTNASSTYSTSTTFAATNASLGNFAQTLTTGTSTMAGRLLMNSASGENILNIAPQGNIGSSLDINNQAPLAIDNTLNASSSGLLVSSDQNGTPDNPLVVFQTSGANYHQGILWLVGAPGNTDGASFGLRVDDGNPDIEMYNTAEGTPSVNAIGAYEMDVNNDLYRINGRNTANNSFDTIAWFARNDRNNATDSSFGNQTNGGGKFCLGCGFSFTDIGRFGVVATSTPGTPYFTLSTDVSHVGNVMTVLPNGNVGIATTTPGSKLSVAGNEFISGNITSAKSAASIFPYASTTGLSVADSATFALTGEDYVALGTTTNIDPSIGAGRGELMVQQFTDDVNHGIDVLNTLGTLSGRYWEGTGGTTHIDSGPHGERRIDLNEQGGGFVGIGTSTPYASLSIGIPTTYNGAVGPTSDRPGNFALAISSSTETATTTLFTITNAGLLGVGTTSPAYTMDMYDPSNAILLSIHGGGSGQINSGIKLDQATGVRGAGIYTYNPAATREWFFGNPYIGGATAGTDNFAINRKTSVTTFSTTAADTANSTNLLMLTGAGSLGIASSTPWKTLSVVGTAAINGLSAFATGDSAVCQRAGGELTVDSGVSSCIVSSRTVKHNIQSDDLSSALSRFIQLSPVTFAYNGTNKEDIGLIAEDVSAVDSRYAQYNAKTGKPQAINWSAIEADIIKVLQDVLSRLSGDEKKLQNQQKEIDHLQAEIDALKK